jgi:hypothetical protein
MVRRLGGPARAGAAGAMAPSILVVTLAGAPAPGPGTAARVPPAPAPISGEGLRAAAALPRPERERRIDMASDGWQTRPRRGQPKGAGLNPSDAPPTDPTPSRHAACTGSSSTAGGRTRRRLARLMPQVGEKLVAPTSSAEPANALVMAGPDRPAPPARAGVRGSSGGGARAVAAVARLARVAGAPGAGGRGGSGAGGHGRPRWHGRRGGRWWRWHRRRGPRRRRRHRGRGGTSGNVTDGVDRIQAHFTIRLPLAGAAALLSLSVPGDAREEGRGVSKVERRIDSAPPRERITEGRLRSMRRTTKLYGDGGTRARPRRRRHEASDAPSPEAGRDGEGSRSPAARAHPQRPETGQGDGGACGRGGGRRWPELALGARGFAEPGLQRSGSSPPRQPAPDGPGGGREYRFHPPRCDERSRRRTASRRDRTAVDLADLRGERVPERRHVPDLMHEFAADPLSIPRFLADRPDEWRRACPGRSGGADAASSGSRTWPIVRARAG